ncbi:VOC family protein [Actinoplanes sp. G11-F43]|uniref:VOC family protein n=1 Tax=Actinoplanes sp. G11-F43 TaxID=3424130 RepID=UPI003D3443A4
MTAVRGIDNVLFTVGDLDAAVEFYGERLGLPVAFRRDESGIVLFRLGEQAPGLLVRRTGEEPRNVTGPRLWLEVADARATAGELADAGVALLDEPFPVTTGWTVEVADPWGNVVGFTDHTSRDAGV